MSQPVSLMEFVKLLLQNDGERARFAADPDATLAHHGLSELSPADVHDAVLLVQDTLTVDWSQAFGAGASAAHTAHTQTADAPATSEWWWSDEPEPVATEDVQPVHHAAPDVVHDALYDAPDLHFGP
ncbi:MAG TPA: IniB N-terminal domain-containing protein [Pseudonocardia sp.]